MTLPRVNRPPRYHGPIPVGDDYFNVENAPIATTAILDETSNPLLDETGNSILEE